jgi:hypothetical protein
VTAAEPLTVTGERVAAIAPIAGAIEGDVEKAASFSINNECNDDFLVLNALLRAGVAVALNQPTSPDLRQGLWIPADETARQVLKRVLPKVSTRVRTSRDVPQRDCWRVLPSRIGLYQPWVPSMDEGWTRLVLEKYGFEYTTLHNADIIAGRLKERIDALIIPSVEPRTLRSGHGANETEPAYTGGLGSQGADALRAFLQAGGTLIFLADSTDYAIEELRLPVKNVLKGLKTSEFYAPGSILRASVSATSSWVAGVPPRVSVYFDRGQAFTADYKLEHTLEYAGTEVTTLLHYGQHDPLESGWLLGPEKIAGKAALVEVSALGGHVFLFGFRPQYRGQPHGTFRLLFNTLLRIERGPSASPPAG